MPFGVKETLTYIGWLMDSRRVQSTSIESYLAGVRVAHMKAGHSVPVLRPDVWLECSGTLLVMMQGSLTDKTESSRAHS